VAILFQLNIIFIYSGFLNDIYMMLPVIVLFIVFALIAVRQVGRIRLQIWQIMLFGALAVLVTGQISLIEALEAIDVDVMLFLFGMFVVGEALEDSGYLWHLSCKLFSRAKSRDQLLLLILFTMGIISAFIMNDTVAIIGTPMILLLARDNGMSPKPLLLALAFAVTIGSVMSPIGNPQNLLIAINGNIANPFITFFRYLSIPTFLNLLCAYLVLKLFYKKEFKGSFTYKGRSMKDNQLALLSKISLTLILLLIAVRIIIVFLRIPIDFKLTYISLIAALPIVLFSHKRLSIIRSIDWETLIFFASMFILMRSVWNTGFFQSITIQLNLNLTALPIIFSLSILLSQLISNVPLVALYLPILTHGGATTKELIALAAGSTIAGNLSILGAASNIIIIQNTEKRGEESITFLEFVKVGAPLTLLNTILYWIFLTLM